ncbi:uncharacterized protein FFB20_03238 [Fusarium fujikuroi]|uniref:Uncharacterized protein n=1 Tax=Gibberella fujikuroi (strain CBS 195.34 / IMI 58289 / NRRL A-6831) TaxID=1279085 RepID=S0DPQ6_GIBF5|nr:uncharacterized protein FFUJ_04346 [Fusarium fujikuroi IMI 58289]KLO85525.1 uncharacterized protein LW93_14137 [Fusarium fujikuroi]KLP07467.1 uncharacterized protein Y057_8280 [Fusarium fujikuroi]CCT64431.1 uncharacterized protein FFUJ_04346 [Fusarium fujikuroi IMI 58289]SCN68895.1 uncharacterized protein FFB20_03238 [Fusarium fujikuroi]SCN73836.1 uncharacterized protein FFE2_02951 [Fusarium fujikuroi]
MDRFRNTAGEYEDSATMDDLKAVGYQEVTGLQETQARSPLTKTRSMSDGGGTPSRLSPSPRIVEASRRTSKDDTSIPTPQPVTPRRPNFSNRGFSIQMPPREFTPPAANSYVKPAPLSPKLDHSQIYASPTNILPRRSRGLDFSRAATSLHHSTLAEQSSPDSSPTAGGRAMNIPSRRSHYAGPEQTSTSLWSVMGNQEKMHISSSLGSQAIGSDSSSTSDDDELMDEDMDETYVTTPQVHKIGPILGPQGSGGTFGSPAMSSLMSFQQRQRPRKQAKKKNRGPLGLGFSGASLSKSPPTNSSRARRESISWQANQLHISGADSDETRAMGDVDGLGDGQRNVIRRPKTKGFARIRAALMEESTPAESEFRREAEVVKQVRDCDMELEPRITQPALESTQSTTAPSSPNLTQQEGLNDVPEDDIMGDISMGLSSSFKQHAIKNSKGKTFWDTFSESSSTGGARTTPPPAAFLPRGSSSGISEDVAMDSPSVGGATNGSTQPPTAAEITRRINSKRRRDDDFDPVSFKRRAVSPGMSVHNSPVMQSPLQRDGMSWGSRPGSNGGDKAGSSAPSEAGSTPGNLSGSSSAAGRLNSKGRVGFQGMIDTHDGIMRMSIE